MPLSATISTGLVKGRFGDRVVAGPNGDKLLIPARGRIDFVGMTPITQFPTVDPPVTMLRPTAVGILDSEGYLCTPDTADPSKPGERMVLMQAPNDPDSTVRGWTWRGTPRFVNADGTRVHNSMEPFTFDLPFGDVPFDLVNAVSVPESAGVGTEQAIILAASAQAHAASADAAAEAAAADAKVAREGAAIAVEAARAAAEEAKAPTDASVDRGIERAGIPGIVAEAVASDEVVTQAAAGAVNAKLDEAGVMRGHASLPSKGEDFVWRQTTESGHYLPLGYTAEGRLDEFARKVWREDVNRTHETFHPDYARAMVTEDNQLLAGLTWDGRWIIPGLEIPDQPKPLLYNDAPYTPESDVRPLNATATKWAMWGSSSAGGIATIMAQMAVSKGIWYYNGGWGGEKSSHIAARLGSVPAKLTFPDNLVPASSDVQVASSNLTVGNMRGFSGYVVGIDGRRAYGKLTVVSNTFRFMRDSTDTSGAVEVPLNVQLIPTDGHAQRDAVTMLWMGKNNLSETQRVIDETNASFEYLAPLVKRCLVLGHFNDTNTAASAASRQQIKTINDAYARRFGAAYVDIHAYLTGDKVWADTGITPTTADREQQAIGNKPPSLSLDDGHMNDKAYLAVRALIEARMKSLGWIN